MSYNVQEFGRRPEVRAVMKSGNIIRAYRIMREFMDTSMSDVLNEFWQAAQEADFVVKTPSGHGVVEVASQRGIPMAFAYLQPFAPTRAFPTFFGSALGLLRLPLGGGYNYLTHQLTDHLVWLVYGDSRTNGAPRIGACNPGAPYLTCGRPVAVSRHPGCLAIAPASCPSR